MIGFEIAPGIRIGDAQPPLIIAGPCVIETEELCLKIGRRLQSVCAELGLQYVFKASFDKANRTSLTSYRGPGLETGLQILQTVKSELTVPILTDVHEVHQVEAAAEVVDILQIPAFLCRQTDLLVAAGRTDRTVNIKKGQFVAPEDLKPAAEKVFSTDNTKVILTERGTTFGYHNLVVDMRGLVIMRSFGIPVVFDATHSVQIPGGHGNVSDGRREFAPYLLRAATAVGIDGVFIETHPSPRAAMSDGPDSIALDDMTAVLTQIQRIHKVVENCGLRPKTL